MRKAFELHIDNRLRLHVVKVKMFAKSKFCAFRVAAAADDFYYFVDIIYRNNQRFKNVSAFKRFSEFKLSAPRNNFVAVLHKILNDMLKREDFRSPFYQRKIYYAEV